MQVYAREKHNTHRGMNSYYPIELVLLSSICIINYYKNSMSVLTYTKYFYIIKYYITPAIFLLEASRIPFSIFLTTIFQSQTSGFFASQAADKLMSCSSKASHVSWAADSIFQLSLRKQLASRKVTLRHCIRESFCMSVGCVVCHFTFIAALLRLWCKFYDPEGSNGLGTLSDIFSPISQATFWQNKAKPACSKKTEGSLLLFWCALSPKDGALQLV